LVDLESFTGRDGSWHLALHFKGTVPQDTALIPGAGVASARWFPLDDLPDRSAVAHHGWYLHVIARAAEKV
jgi:hypothetical protein